MSGLPLLSVREVSLAFGALKVLDRASFDVRPGSIVGLIGPNGAGKTSLFNCISGHYRFESGDIVLSGRSLKGIDPERLAGLGMARTFQHPALFPAMPVLDQVLLALDSRDPSGWIAEALGWPSARRRACVQAHAALELLDQFELRSLVDRPVAALSLAERKGLEIVRALALRPRLLLLDEPAAGLDERAQWALGQMLRRLRDEARLAVLVIDHRIGWLRALCDQMLGSLTCR